MCRTGGGSYCHHRLWQTANEHDVTSNWLYLHPIVEIQLLLFLPREKMKLWQPVYLHREWVLTENNRGNPVSAYRRWPACYLLALPMQAKAGSNPTKLAMQTIWPSGHLNSIEGAEGSGGWHNTSIGALLLVPLITKREWANLSVFDTNNCSSPSSHSPLSTTVGVPGVWHCVHACV